MRRLAQNGWGWMHRARHKLATAAVGAVLCMVSYHAIFGANGFLVFHAKVTESQKLDREIQALQQDNARRESEIRGLKYDRQVIEKVARERLRYARPGEVIYTLQPPLSTQPHKQ